MLAVGVGGDLWTLFFSSVVSLFISRFLGDGAIYTHLNIVTKGR